MSSIKSSQNPLRSMQAPQRSNGKLRVAAILKAGSAVIAEKGYEAATMAEIASRSDTQIGSLYHFFPNKEALAGALITRYSESIGKAFDRLDNKCAHLTLIDFTNALLYLLAAFNKDRAAIHKLMEADYDWSEMRKKFRETVLKRITATLMLYRPQLNKESARYMACVLLHNMKAMRVLLELKERKMRAGTINELREMTQLYIKAKLKKS